MIKKQNLKKWKRQDIKKECMICKLIKNQNRDLAYTTIKYKYFLQPQKSSQLSNVQAILSRRSNNQIKNTFKEISAWANTSGFLSRYNNFSQIKTKIKSVILSNSNQQYYLPHFHGQAHRFTMINLYGKIKLAEKTKFRRIEKMNKSNHSTDEQQNDLKSQKRYVNTNENKSQTASMRRLTRNLSNIVRKIEDNMDFHPSLIFDIMDNLPRHNLDFHKRETQQIFKRQLEDNNISQIKEKKQIQILYTNQQSASIKYEQNYGLRPQLRVQERHHLERHSKKISFCPNMKENMPDHIQTDYDCQKIKNKKTSKSHSKKLDGKNRKNGLNSLSRKKQSNKALSPANFKEKLMFRN